MERRPSIASTRPQRSPMLSNRRLSKWSQIKEPKLHSEKFKSSFFCKRSHSEKKVHNTTSSATGHQCSTNVLQPLICVGPRLIFHSIMPHQAVESKCRQSEPLQSSHATCSHGRALNVFLNWTLWKKSHKFQKGVELCKSEELNDPNTHSLLITVSSQFSGLFSPPWRGERFAHAKTQGALIAAKGRRLENNFEKHRISHVFFCSSFCLSTHWNTLLGSSDSSPLVVSLVCWFPTS